jgi:anti-anti-sigma factor
VSVYPSILPPAFTLVVEDQGKTRTISLAEEVDIAAVRVLKAAVQDAFSETGCETLVVDLSAVSFIETTAIGVLFRAYRQSARDRTRLVVIPSVAPAVQRTIALCNLGGLLPFAEQVRAKS